MRDLLYRFRPSGVPGAATLMGVPADRAREHDAELEPLLLLLETTQQECADLLEAARQDAAATRRRDVARAEGILASGRAGVNTHRAAATAQVRYRGHADHDDADRVDEGVLDDLHERVGRLLPSFVGRVTHLVQIRIGARDDTEAPRSGAG
ncbi:MAG: hypothetical protein ABI083_13310 [Lapillicoccus sp.]